MAFAGLLVAVLIGSSGLGIAAPHSEQTQIGVEALEFRLSAEAVSALGHDPREFVAGSLKGAGGEVPCKIHLKGGSTFRPIQDKPSLTVETAGKVFPGKFHLNNLMMDPSLLRERMAAHLYQEAGIACPQARPSRVTLNERDLGFYNVLEAIDAGFLERRFKNSSGNLYEGKGKDIDVELLGKNPVNPGQSGDLEYLIAAARLENPGRRWEEISRVLDVEQFVRVLAMETLTGQVDGYASRRNNYFIYHEPASNKWVMIPRGLDRAFRDMDGRVFPPDKRVLSRAVLRTREGRELYLNTFSMLLSNVMQPRKLTNWIAEQTTALVAASKSSSESSNVVYHSGVLTQYVVERVQGISELLAQAQRTPVMLKAGEELALSGWSFRPMSNSVSMLRSSDGVEAFGIRHAQGVGRGSWRTSLYLEPGNYVFTGKVRASKVSTNKAAAFGASLYTSEQGMGMQRLTGDSDWTVMNQVFTVSGGPAEVTFIADLRTLAGEAWFEKGSLRVRRE